MRLGNTVEFAHVPLDLVPEILNAIDVIVAVCEELRMVDTEVMEVWHIQYIIAAPAVRINDAVRHNLALYDGDQRGAWNIWDNLGINFSTPF